MDYKEALGRWGAKKAGLDPELWSDIRVDLDVDQGWASDNSYAESATVNIEVTYKGKVLYHSNITYEFLELVQEILEVADGKY